MSISSDLTKQSLSQLQAGTGVQTNERDFQQLQKRESQIVKESTDINSSGEQKDTSESRSNSEEQDAAKLTDSKTDEVSQKMRQLNVSLSFELSEEGGDNIVKVIDRQTGELVRQIPSEEFLKISKRIDEIFEEVSDLKGSLVNSEA